MYEAYLTMGSYYKFKVQARNAFGYSDDSNEVTILQGERPSQIAPAVTTTVSNTHVIIDWNAPSNQGAPITRYTILVR